MSNSRSGKLHGARTKFTEDQLKEIADRNKLPKDFSISSYCSCGEKKYRRSDPKCEHCMAMDLDAPTDIIPLDHRARDPRN